MKRILSVVLAMLCVCSMLVSLTSCDKGSDWATIEEQGYFTCGITVYEPMNYYEDGELVGFDTEFAKAVADYLGVEVRFKEIDWSSKYVELDSGSIDLIWNGFTYGDEDGVSRAEYVDFTYSYLENRQCLVTKTDALETINSADDLKGKRAVVEAGSSGESLAKTVTDEDKVTGFPSQPAALRDLLAGNADFAIIDYQMANSMVGKGDYASLSINEALKPEAEVYAIGCRKGSDLTEKINEAIDALYEDGTLADIAAEYDLTNDLKIGK